MTSFLWMVSFLLHIILLYTVYSLSKQLQASRNKEKEEIAQLLSQFTEELQQENEKIARTIKMKKTIKEEASTQEHIKQQATFHEKYPHKQVDGEDQFAPVLYKMMKKEKDKVESSPEARMIHLYKQGETIEKIARKFKRGKTEVELIVKLQNN